MSKIAEIKREDLYAQIGGIAAVHPEIAGRVLEAFFEFVPGELLSKGGLRIDDFGTFVLTERKARVYKNKFGSFPKPAKNYVRFDEHKKIEDRINA